MSAALPTEPSQHLVKQPISSDSNKFFNKPSYLLLTTAGTIFVSEILIMILINYLPPLSAFQVAFVDAFLLILIVFPSLYFLVFKLLSQYIAQQRQNEIDKDNLIAELNTTLNEVKTLRGIVPICASCKKIRDDNGFWQQVEVYVSAHSDVMFSHGCCPECADTISATL